MAARRRSRVKSTARRTRTARSRSGTYRRSSVRRTSTRRSSARRSTPRTSRVVVEIVQPGPVRAGEAVGIGEKVAPMPRLKPRF